MPKKLDNFSIQEYLDIEIKNDTKYEYHDGTITAMAGGTLNHGLICGNIFGEIRTALRNKKSGCTPMNSEIKLHIEKQNRFLYPDTMVVCNKIETSKTEPNAVINPTVIIEVLSKSTASYDRGDKFFFYRQIPTLKEYILIEQDKSQIELYQRQNDLWKITRVSGFDKSFFIESLGIEIGVEAVYFGISI